MERIECYKGKTIFKKGDAANGLYIVGTGAVGIYFPTNITLEKPDIILKKNATFGEMGVIDTAPRMATAKAIDEAIVLFISKSEFEERLSKSDTIVRGVLAILSERLRDIQIRR